MTNTCGKLNGFAMGPGKSTASIFVCAVLLLLASGLADAEVEMRVVVDRGRDVGQNFGSLFEGRSRDGAFVFGAGFLGVYNSYYRSDRHSVHFFIRPTDAVLEPVVERLPRPNEIAGTYLFSQQGRLYSANPGVRVWNQDASCWEPDSLSQRGRMRVGTDRLLFEDGVGVECNGRQVLASPEQARYHRFYYAHGHLFFYQTDWAGETGYRKHVSDAEGYTKLYACPWHPADGGPVDLDKAVVNTLPFVGESPFSYGQLGEDVLTCSNIGGIYVFDGEAWRTVLDGSLKESYQVYSMLNFHDRLLLGQYPAGELFEFDGEKVIRLVGWPPRLEGVRASAREAQTTTLYGGDLFVGVWPWGELWRYRHDTKRWSFVRRMFTHPPATDKTTHPYEKECAALGVVANQWGQRVTSLEVLGSSMMISTSAKSPCAWEPKFDFVGDGKWKAYGSVTRLEIPGHLSAPIAWTGGPTVLSFTVGTDGIRITQDGKVVAEAVLGGELAKAPRSAADMGGVTWGRGVYGAFRGAALSGEIRVDGGEARNAGSIAGDAKQ